MLLEARGVGWDVIDCISTDGVGDELLSCWTSMVMGVLGAEGC